MALTKRKVFSQLNDGQFRTRVVGRTCPDDKSAEADKIDHGSISVCIADEIVCHIVEAEEIELLHSYQYDIHSNCE